MSINDKKDYLKSYRLQENLIRTLKRLCIENPSQKDVLHTKIEECENLRTQIAEKIFKIKDTRYKVLLYEKYMNGRTLEEIALILNYSKRHAERLHIAALKSFKL